jgi:pimeloyl-ACP methyl ester carboxylesterase
MLYTIFTVIAIIFAILLIAFIIYLNTGQKIPADTDKLINEVLNTKKEDLKEFVTGQTGYAKNGDISIWYEIIGAKTATKGTLLLVNGLSQTCLDWQPYIYEPFIKAGYQVIRFDNRDVGMSDWIDNEEWQNGKKYKLEDMAKDAIAVLDALNIDKTHLMGMSMGGMISQRLVISYPERFTSLTSVMSTGYFDDESLTQVTATFALDMYRYFTKYRDLRKMDNRLKLHLGVQRMLMGKGGYSFDNKTILEKAYYELTNRKGYHKHSQPHHGYAIKKSGSRYDELKQIDIPTLVIHGTDDPLLLFEHGKKYAPMIPNSTSLFIEGMGHDFPRAHMPEIAAAVLANFEKA